MNKKIIAIMLVFIVLVGTGCFGKDPTVKPGAAEHTGANNGGSDPELIIKTDNGAADEEADKMLEEVDRQLDSLLKALDQLESIDTNELPDEEGN